MSPDVERQVGESLQVVSSGRRAYQALSLAADIASGGALVSAMGMLASGGDLGGMLGPQAEKLNSAEREEAMSANEAQMSAIRLRQFEEHGGKASYYAASY